MLSIRVKENTVLKMLIPAALMAVGGLSLALHAQAPQASASGGAVKSFYELKTRTLEGKPAELAMYRGKVSLVVNVASKCGFTPQYEGLEKLHREMSSKGLNILGFPSNDFGGQEPGTPEEIQTFCKTKYDVTFPLFEKLVTRLGPDQSQIYAFLWKSGYLPAWNFSKYVIGKDAQVVA